jgi:cytochrome c
MHRLLIVLTLTAASAALPLTAARAQNADNGKTVFRQVCGICHTVVAGKNMVGPSLSGVAGRKSGSLPDFHYSDAMKNANLTWDEATLDKYLSSPRGVVPGTLMAYAGLKDDQKRKDLIAYLATVH